MFNVRSLKLRTSREGQPESGYGPARAGTVLFMLIALSLYVDVMANIVPGT